SCRRDAAAERGDDKPAADAVAEVVDDPGPQPLGVFLEGVGRVDEDTPGTRASGVQRGVEATEELAMDLGHRRGGLPGAHDREDSWGRHLRRSYRFASLT